MNVCCQGCNSFFRKSNTATIFAHIFLNFEIYFMFFSNKTVNIENAKCVHDSSTSTTLNVRAFMHTVVCKYKNKYYTNIVDNRLKFKIILVN